ncbi:MAG: hypothetical protein AB1Z23_06710 [Eubacteriales bacterium]
MKIISKLKSISIFLIAAMALFLLPATAYAKEGVGVTGSFSSYKYKVVQGERVDTPQVNVVFINNYNHSVQLKIYTDTPEGVTIPIDQEVVTVAANSRVDVPVVLIVAEDTLPGTYDIWVKAKLIEDIEEGRINIGSEFALKTKLTVLGEAADLDIDVVDEVGEPIKAIMNLYQIDPDGSRAPLAYSDRGHLVERVIPGEYEVLAFWNDYQLVKHNFTVAADEQYSKTLVAQTVQLYSFTAHPVFVEGTENELATANLRFILHNIYRELEDARVSLIVYKDDELLEQKDIFLYEKLEVKKHELGMYYIPSQGWDRAEYKFVLQFFVDEKDDNGNILDSKLYAESLPVTLDTSSGLTFKKLSEFFSPQMILIVILAAVLAGIFFLTKYLLQRAGSSAPKSPIVPAPKAAPALCPDCHGEEEVECPTCDGTGKTYYGSIEEECLYCSGVGKVVCATCVNPKQLIVCPRCNGNSKVDGEECSYCNGLGHVLSVQYARYKGDIKMKLGKKKR